jgi:hypothetical protein
MDKYLEFEQDGIKYNLYDMPDDFVIKGDLLLRFKCLEELPDLSKVIVEGTFWCCDNKLKSLKGCPKEVGGAFNCSSNQLTSLEGAPQKVGGSFSCEWNQLTSLKGAPRKIGGGMYVKVNKLENLEGAPEVIGGDFNCTANQELEDLKDIPQMKPDGKIICPRQIVDKYGLSSWEIEARELYDNPVYQQELKNSGKIRELKRRINPSGEFMTRAEEDAKRQAKHKAGFEAFKKKFGPKEREE